MFIFGEIFSMLIRLGELIFACIIAGLVGTYLNSSEVRHDNNWHKSRFIYTEVVAAFSILFSVFWFLPLSAKFVHWHIDFMLFMAWTIVFGLLVDFVGPLDCGNAFYWGNVGFTGTCDQWKSDVAFSFMSGIFWLVSTVLGIYYAHSLKRALRPLYRSPATATPV